VLAVSGKAAVKFMLFRVPFTIILNSVVLPLENGVVAEHSFELGHI
jgi:hypothetical protein